MNEMIFNIGLIGNRNVGKSNLLMKFTDNIIEENASFKIGIEFRNKELEINNLEIKLNIINIFGTKRYLSIPKYFSRKGDGLIFVFDLTNKDSFEKIRACLINFNKESQNYQKILVGNKFNLDRKRTEVEKERIEKLSEKFNMKYFEINSKDGTNVELIFKEITSLILSSKPGLINQEFIKKAKQTNSPKIVKNIYDINNFKLKKLLKYINQ